MAPKHLLTIWAHPDDESFGPAGTLRMAHERGWETTVICATKGEHGQTSGLKLEADQQLGAMRLAELQCACHALGVAHVDCWDFPDEGLPETPINILIERILIILRQWKPDVVITFGPDGITGHPDHAAISNATTQAWKQLQDEPQQPPRRRLYYVTTGQQEVKQRMGDAPHPEPATTVLNVQQFEPYKREALACHASQQDDWRDLLLDRDWLTIDRLFRVDPKWEGGVIETTIFDD